MVSEVKPDKTTTEEREKQLAIAVEKVKKGTMSLYKMELESRIPRTTIRNHLFGRNKSLIRSRPPIFNQDQEKLMSDLIITLAGWGYPLEKDQFKELAKECAKNFGVTYKSSEWSPGEDWLLGYLIAMKH